MKGILKGTSAAAWLAAAFTAVLWPSVIWVGLTLRTVWQKRQSRTVTFLWSLRCISATLSRSQVAFFGLFCAEGYPSWHFVFFQVVCCLMDILCIKKHLQNNTCLMSALMQVASNCAHGFHKVHLQSLGWISL